MTLSNQLENLSSVSVIIPTLDRKDKLHECLDSLKKVEYPKSLLEIIVVDNGSTDGTDDMVHSRFKDVKLVVEPRRGVSFARNTGVRHSKGDVISFLDDDCQAESDWLRKTVQNFVRDEIVGVGGPVILRTEAIPVSKKLLDVFIWFSSFDLGPVRRNVVKFPYLSGANMSFRRKAFERTSFDPRLGPPRAYLEDFDFCERLLRLGLEIIYDPEVTVYHNPVVSKFSISYILFSRGPKEGFSLYFMGRKRLSWFKSLRGISYSFLIRTFKFLLKMNGMNLVWLTWNFYALVACLRYPFNLYSKIVIDT